ncbi:MAG: hypothetical protein WCI74_19820 [Actinomycetes bacterium]
MTTLKAVGSGRSIDPRSTGETTVLLFHSSDTAEAAQDVNKAVRADPKYQDSAAVLVASVVDLSSVPRLVRKVAERAIRGAYDKAAKALPAGVSPEQYIVILPDWDGSVTKSFGLSNTGKTAALVVLNPQGTVIGSYQGADPKSAVMEFLAQAN